LLAVRASRAKVTIRSAMLKARVCRPLQRRYGQ
jgi:hypothetical protein